MGQNVIWLNNLVLTCSSYPVFLLTTHFPPYIFSFILVSELILLRLVLHIAPPKKKLMHKSQLSLKMVGEVKKPEVWALEKKPYQNGISVLH